MVISFIFIVGCTSATSVILQVKDNQLVVLGFGRGQSYMSMMCIVCPHVGAKVNATTLDGGLICKGGNEVIVGLDMTENARLAVRCKGLEAYEGQKILVGVDGFVGGALTPLNETKFRKEMAVQFEKV